MKRFTLICVLYIVPWIGFTQDLVPTISTNGGYWHRASIWSTGELPGPNDIVEIKGQVIARYINTSLKGLVVDPDVEFHMIASNITVGGDVVNQGIINGTSPLTVSGNIHNTGTWNNWKTTLTPSQPITITGNPIESQIHLGNDIQLQGEVSFKGDFYPNEYKIISDGTLDLRLSEIESAKSLNIDGSAQVYISNIKGVSIDAPEGVVTLGRFYSLGQSTKARELHFEALASLGQSASIYADTIVVAQDGYLSGGRDGYRQSAHIHGDLINYGTVASPMSVYLYGNAENHGVWDAPTYINFASDTQSTEFAVSQYERGLSSALIEKVSGTKKQINSLLTDDRPYYISYRSDEDAWSSVQSINAFNTPPQYTVPKQEFFMIDMIRDNTVSDTLPLTLTAQDEAFDGTVYLSTTHGKIYPRQIEIKNGEWQGDVQLFDALENQQIHVQGTGMYAAHSGRSNYFITEEPVSAPGIVEGIVRDHDATRPSGQIVTFYNLRGRQHTSITDEDGEYSATLSAGEYSIITGNRVTSTSVAPAKTTIHNITKNTPCEPSDKVPVLLVPGIEGSDSVGSNGWFPNLKSYLPHWDSQDLEIHDPAGQVGFGSLQDVLITQGYQKNCTVFHVPYDWSISVVDSAQQYLKPWIEHAKNVSGKKQVDIVAHSMGGLVSRAYIQRDDYALDVRKLAMAGTPNAGSAQSYFSWEGGDPIAADQYGGSWSEDLLVAFSGATQFQTNTLSRNYMIKTGNSSSPCHSQGFWENALDIAYWQGTISSECDNVLLRGFLHSHAPAVGELYPTYDFLYDAESKQSLSPSFENSLLRALNQQSCSGDCEYTFEPLNQRGVDIMLFIGHEEYGPGYSDPSTPEHIFVSPTSRVDYYVDGDVVLVSQGFGDGTVLQSSVEMELMKYDETDVGHGSLIKAYQKEIVENFLIK